MNSCVSSRGSFFSRLLFVSFTMLQFLVTLIFGWLVQSTILVVIVVVVCRRKRGKRLQSGGRPTGDKSGKGLRHFSMKVCEKVQQKGITSYNEVRIVLVRF